jgi:hypothetical protein
MKFLVACLAWKRYREAFLCPFSLKGEREGKAGRNREREGGGAREKTRERERASGGERERGREREREREGKRERGRERVSMIHTYKHTHTHIDWSHLSDTARSSCSTCAGLT